MTRSLFFRLNATARAAPVSALHIDEVAEVLAAVGLDTLGALLGRIERDRQWTHGIPNFNNAAVSHVRQRLSALSSSIDDDGDIDWQAFEQTCGIAFGTAESKRAAPKIHVQDVAAGDRYLAATRELVPCQDVANGHEFVRAFPEVIAALIRTREHEVDRLILIERLTKPPNERKTLDQLASAISGPLTRERVRQREKKLIDQLANALLFNRCKRLGVNFRESFTRYWQSGADRFGQKQVIDFDEFIQGLCDSWNVRPEEIFIHLPLLTSVLTSKATIPEQMRNQMKLDPRIYRELDPDTRAKPLRKLATGKASDEIRSYGIDTVGELIDAVRIGRGPDLRTRAGRISELLVSALAEGMTSDRVFDWKRYAWKLGLVNLPLNDSSSAEEFLGNLAGDIEAIIQNNGMTARAADIFKLRVAVPRAARLTLSEVAVVLNTYGPSVKREESLLLANLNDQLVDRDFTNSRVFYSPRFLNYWEEASRIYEDAGNDFEKFCSLAAERWTVSRQLVNKNADILWAVLNQYPSGRPSRKRNRPARQREIVAQRPSSGVIVLRGFRCVH